MMKNQFTHPTQERRFVSASVEIRADEGEGKPKVRGYAAKYNVQSENLGNEEYQIFETIQSGSFDEVLNDDVRALFNHDSNLILARSKNGIGTLTLGTDDIGLFYEFEAPDTQAGRDLIENIRLGNVDQSSFSFTVRKEGQKWERTKDGEGPTINKRTITKVSRLFDVSPVTYPAYPDATVALRGMAEAAEAEEQEQSPQENHTINHWQRKMDLLDKTAKQ
jgi:HK97 family phage prohead protease